MPSGAGARKTRKTCEWFSVKSADDAWFQPCVVPTFYEAGAELGLSCRSRRTCTGMWYGRRTREGG